MGRKLADPNRLRVLKYCPVNKLSDLSWKERVALEGVILGKSTQEIADSTKTMEYIMTRATVVRALANLYKEAQLGPVPRNDFYAKVIEWAEDRGLTRRAVETGVLDPPKAPVNALGVVTGPKPEPDMLWGMKREEALAAQQRRLEARRAVLKRAFDDRAEREAIRNRKREAKRLSALEKVRNYVPKPAKKTIPTWSKFYKEPE